MKRRQFLFRTTAALLAASPVGRLVAAGSDRKNIEGRAKRVLRAVHITDCHALAKPEAEQGLRKLAESIQSLDDPAEIILNTGDTIMDALEANTLAKVEAQWEVFQHHFLDAVNLPMHTAIGNHDVWGWGVKGEQAEAIKKHPLYGKAWAVKAFRLPNRYYSFDFNGWHFIALDSTRPNPGGSWHYSVKLDDEQYEWLMRDLQKTDSAMPVCVFSHMPILSVTPFAAGFWVKDDQWQLPNNLIHVDAKRLKDLFYSYKNVKVCISGHMHQQDEAGYLGVKYWCNGAVSGAWWGGANQEFSPAYALIDFYEDGHIERQMITYDWQ